MSLQCPRPFTGNQLSVSHIELLRRYARSLELRTSTGAGIRTERGPEGTRISVDRPPARAGAVLSYDFRARLGTREPGEEEGDAPIKCVRVLPGAWSTAGSGGQMFPAGTEWPEEGSEWLWDDDAGEFTLDLPDVTAESWSLVLYWNFAEGEAADWPVVWWTTDTDAPSIAQAAHSSIVGTNQERAIPICRIYQAITGSGETESRSHRLQQVQFGSIRLFVPPVATRGMIATMSPVRRRAEEGQPIYVYDREVEPPELVQVEAEGGEEYFDEAGNPVYSNAGMPWIGDWLRFDDLEEEAIFEPPEPPVEPEE